MLVAAQPDDEPGRLARLASYAILDTGPHQAFDSVVQKAAAACGVPVALISLVDQQRQWFLARHGLDATETHRDLSFCAHVVADGANLVVEDSTSDARFRDNPLVTDAPYVISYAGVPVHSADGHVLGTLCVIDHKPRAFSTEDLATIRLLADNVESLLEAGLNAHRYQRAAESHGRFVDHVTNQVGGVASGIRGLADTLGETALDGRQRQLLQLMDTGAFRLQTLTEKVDRHAQVSHGRFLLTPKAFDLSKLLDRIVGRAATQARIKRTTVRVDVDSSLTPLIVGPEQATGVIANELVENAVNFTDGGAIEVTAARRGGLILDVIDSGGGIPPEFQAEIFLEHNRGCTRTASRHPGLGLGLTTAAKLAEQAGGRVTLVRSSEEGSHFRAEIPLSDRRRAELA